MAAPTNVQKSEERRTFPSWPWKHPKTGVYWIRRRVPAHLVAAGRSEDKQSPRTKDTVEAKRAFAVAIAAIEERWANLKRGLHVPALARQSTSPASTMTG